MLKYTQETPFYLVLGAADMRKSINRFALIAEHEFDLDLFSGSYFAFCNRSRTLIKILYWDGTDFCLRMKWLEESSRGRKRRRR